MSKTARIEIRVTESQRKQIENNAHTSGYVTLSSYLRDRGLGMLFDAKQLGLTRSQKTIREFEKYDEKSTNAPIIL